MSMLLATLLALLVGFACPRGWLWAEPVVPESQSVIRNVVDQRLLLSGANGSLRPFSGCADERNHSSLMRNPAFSSLGEHSFVPFPHLVMRNLSG